MYRGARLQLFMVLHCTRGSYGRRRRHHHSKATVSAVEVVQNEESGREGRKRGKAVGVSASHKNAKVTNPTDNNKFKLCGGSKDFAVKDKVKKKMNYLLVAKAMHSVRKQHT